MFFLIFCSIPVCLYVLIMLAYYKGWKDCPMPKEWDTSCHGIDMTVLIPARNEAEHIVKCLQSIADCLPPSGNTQIVVINDHSTDQTAQLVESFSQLHKSERLQFVLLHLKDYPELNPGEIAFKKRALEYGIANATGHIICTTDADCIVSSHWLRAVEAAYQNPEVQMTSGPVLFHHERGMLSYFQSLDFCGMMGITAAGISQGWQRMGNGANLSFRKSAFHSINGYAGNDHLASGDDMFLIQKMAKAFPNGLLFLKSHDAVVYTLPQYRLSAFYRQRMRWATKSGAYQEKAVQMALAIVWLACLVIFCTILVGLLAGGKWLVYGLALFIVKAIADAPLIVSTARFYGKSSLLIWFLPAVLLHLLYIVMIGTMGLFVKNYQWKGREVK